MTIRRVSLIGAALALAILTSGAFRAVFAGTTTVTIDAAKDNTLYEDAGGTVSNGAGDGLFSGMILRQPLVRRAVLQFDVASAVPAGATILDATLTLHVSKSISGPQTSDVFRLTSDWGEGTSDAGFPGGSGTAATTNDATWIHTFFSGSFWSNAGGDFVGAASASTTVDGVGFYSWSSSQMIDDVQDMLDNAASNFGWIVITDESATPSAKKFDSRESATPANRPKLVVEYTTESALDYCQGVDGVDTLTVNGDNGVGSGHVVGVNAGGPISFAISKPAAGGNGKFFVHMNVGSPKGSTLDPLPGGLGASCFTFLLNRGASYVCNWNSLGKEQKIGSSVYFGTPISNPARADTTFLSLPGGDMTNMPAGSEFTLQGVIINPAATSPKGVSITNAVVVQVQ